MGLDNVVINDTLEAVGSIVENNGIRNCQNLMPCFLFVFNFIMLSFPDVILR